MDVIESVAQDANWPSRECYWIKRCEAERRLQEAFAAGLSMLEMHAAGFSARAIGRAFGTHHHMVLDRVRRSTQG